VLLLLAELAGKRQNKMADLNWKDALIIGTFPDPVALSRHFSLRIHHHGRDAAQPGPSSRSALLLFDVRPVMLGAGLMATFDLFQIRRSE
jgi:hypothetical protein